MTCLMLNIQRDTDLAILLPLLNRLQISYVRNDIDLETPSSEIKDFLMKGLPEKENFIEWVSEWERSREDRPLAR